MASAGRVLPINKGAYNSETAYSPLDIVSYNGTTFCCKKSCINVTPIEGEYWQCWIDISGKVDKVAGKGLSTNDFDNTYKGNVDDLVEALPLVQTSVRSINAQINTPTTGLVDRVAAAENSITNDKAIREIKITADGIKTAETLLKELSNAALAVYNSLSNGQILEFLHVRCELFGATLLMNFQGQVNPIRVGTDTFSGRIRCASIYHRAGADDYEIPCLVCASNYAYASMKKINSSNVISSTSYDVTTVPTSGRVVFITYKVY